MKTKTLVWILSIAAAILAVALSFIGYEWRAMNIREQSARAEEARMRSERESRMEEKRVEFEDRRIREQRERVAAENSRIAAVRNLREYLEREENLLKETVSESIRENDEILNDRKKLSLVLSDLDRENALLAEQARTNGWKRYEKAERVMMILKHPVMNELAIKYLGEDFSAMKAECRSQIKSILDMQSETARRLAENRAKYNKAQSGIDEDVDKKTGEARTMTLDSNKDLEKRLTDLVAKRDNRAGMLLQLKKKGTKSKSVLAEINALQDELVALEKEIGRVKEVVAVSRANVAHIAATVAETGARRRGDNALSTRQDDDNAVHAEMAHERTVFNLAVAYEGRSLDAIRASMRSRSDILNVRNILDTLYSLAKASANLYGVISIDFFVDVVVGRWHADWVRLCKRGLPWQMLEVRAKIEAADLAFNQGDVVFFPIRDNNTRRAAIRGQHEGKTPWLPENEADFLAFGDYAELRRTAAAQEFRDVLRMDGGGKLDNRMVEVIVGHCNQEFGDDDVLNLVSCLTPRTMGVDRERIARILTDVSNTTRAWALFGHTAEELGIRHEVGPQDRMPEGSMRELAEGFPSPELLADAGLAAPKVGRNDPCPCGSGKKYKKCCGRNSM